MKKLFLVDQNQLVRETFGQYLESKDWLFYCLESMDDFTFRCKDFDPDLIIIDVTQISAPVVSEIPVAYFGFRDALDSTSWLTSDMLVLEKPLEIDSLVDRLNSYL